MHKERTTLERKEHAFAAVKNAVLPLVLVACMVFGAVWIYGEASTQYTWQWARVWRYVGTFQTDNFFGTFKAGLLLEGLGTTLLIVLYSLVFTALFAQCLVFMKLGQSPVLIAVSSGIISVIRNTPLLIQLFLWYFVFADIFGLTPFATAVLCLAENTCICDYAAGFPQCTAQPCGTIYFAD